MHPRLRKRYIHVPLLPKTCMRRVYMDSSQKSCSCRTSPLPFGNYGKPHTGLLTICLIELFKDFSSPEPDIRGYRSARTVRCLERAAGPQPNHSGTSEKFDLGFQNTILANQGVNRPGKTDRDAREVTDIRSGLRRCKSPMCKPKEPSTWQLLEEYVKNGHRCSQMVQQR